ncbi:MAG TPA: hypothetical protein VMM60_01620 [Ilumatobacter sp.]|nr:hypothetical protein [Ilumatobacter sp.]
MNDFNRRQLLRSGGLALSFGAVLAACGSNRAGSTDPGRLGVAVPPEPLAPTEFNDLAVLRTLQSIQYTALEVYARIADNGGLPGDDSGLAERAVADHTRHASELGAMISGAGGEEYTCANAFQIERLVDPAFAAVEGDDTLAPTDDAERDLWQIANGFEDWIGRCSQDAVGLIAEDISLRSGIMRLAGETTRLSSAFALHVNPDSFINPILLGRDAMATDEMGFPIPYALPSTFGQVTSIDLLLGSLSDEGGRVKLQLQTPAANSFIYADDTC